MSLFDLKGRVALVTGGNGGIGLGMARGLAAGRRGRGHRRAQQGQVGSRGCGDGQARRQDGGARRWTSPTRPNAARRWTTRSRRLGRLDILINNAGINIRKPPHELALEEWKQVIDINLTSTFMCSPGGLPAMQEAGGGKIINIGSMLSIFGAPFAPAYGASKGGIVQLTKSLATAWAKDNIQVNAVLPGWIDTDLTRGARAARFRVSTSMVLMRTPARRWGVPEEFWRRRVPGQQGVRLHHRHGHSGGWRVLGPGVSSDRHGPTAPISRCRSGATSCREGSRHLPSPQTPLGRATVSPLWWASTSAARDAMLKSFGGGSAWMTQPGCARHRDARQSLQPAGGGQPVERHGQYGMADLPGADGLPG